MTMRINKDRVNSLSIHEDAKDMLERAYEENIETVWDRLKTQEPQCGYCALGLSCRNCSMGPCRIDPFEETGPKKGICGADADIIVARNLARTIAAGASAHSDHGRDILEALYHTGCGTTSSYEITDPDKLKNLAKEYGVTTDGKDIQEIAKNLAWEMMEEFGIRREELTFVKRAPEARRAVWEKLGIIPRGIDRENVEVLHRTHMGVDNKYVNILLHAMRTALSDGWGGSLIATELSDVLFGTPKPITSKVNLGVLKADEVNIALHGHNPMLSDVIVRAAEDKKLLKLAKDKGAHGINLVGLCCTGNELLMRRGIPMAGNHLMQELVIMTGALEAMIVDYQCIMPAVTNVARCFHTKVISTFDKAKFKGATHISFDPAHGMEIGAKIVRMAIENYSNRVPERVHIPGKPVDMMAGFSVEAIVGALGGSPEPLVNAIKEGKIRGAVGVVGCNNPKIRQDYAHVTLTQRLIEKDILVVVTGCAAVANGKAGHMMPQASEMAGPGLGAVCKSLGIPPVLHMGSCVDNTRILLLGAALANFLGVDMCDLPLAGAAPEWYSEKAVSIGTYIVASGIYTVLGVQPAIFGSPNVVKLLAEGLEDVVGATFAVEPNPERAAVLIQRHIEKKRKALGLSHIDPASIPMPS
ncbi:MAG: anaerobic carbon-monoxide dehydrogenase catalytic subunit [bacterium]